ncbi:hypothetical protein BHM03_00012348 [Ensete ventricosum]|nr:hypothetical protein BHM03_00012348 [Ensete ventricosum]
MPLILPASLFPLQIPNPSSLCFSRPKPCFAVVKAAGSVSTGPRRRVAPESRDASEAAGLVSTRPRRSRDASEAAGLVSTRPRRSRDASEAAGLVSTRPRRSRDASEAASSVSTRPRRRVVPKGRDASEAAGFVSTRPRRRVAPKGRDASEEAELVRLVLRKSGDGKEALVVTLSKFVRVIRTEHCFLLFEELGKQDRWLQCLEVGLCSSLGSFGFWLTGV